MKAFITKITPWHPRKIRIQWELDEVGESGTFTFDVERSGSPGGPWTVVESGLTNVYTYDDMLVTEDADTLSLSRDIYYRIKVTPPSGASNSVYSLITNTDGQTETEQLDPIPAIGYRVNAPGQYEVSPETNKTQRPRRTERTRLFLLRRTILRHELILLKKLIGIEFYLLKRRHFGTRCAACYDPYTNEVIKGHCDTCFGTSWTGGYFDPILILGRRKVSQVQTQIGKQTKDDTNHPQIQVLDFPLVDEGDILVEKQHNKRFLVKQRYHTTLKTITVHQTLSVSELERQAKEYAIPVTL